MKYLMIAMLSFVFIQCSNKTKDLTNASNDIYTVVNVKNESDGATVTLSDARGGTYQTVISIANGNWIDLEKGDRVKVSYEELLEMDPALMIGSKFTKLDKASPTVNGLRYEKEEELTLWVKGEKTVAFGMWGNPQSCLQIIEAEQLSLNQNWQALCDGIEGLNYKPGQIQKIKVSRKWLENHENLMDRTPYDLFLVEVLETRKDESARNTMHSFMFSPSSEVASSQPITIDFLVTNDSAKELTFLPWQTPLEGVLTAGCLKVIYNGEELPYRGIMVKRRPPTDEDYITLQPGESTSEKVDISDSYDFSRAGKYSIQFIEKYQGIVPNSNTIEITIK